MSPHISYSTYSFIDLWVIAFLTPAVRRLAFAYLYSFVWVAFKNIRWILTEEQVNDFFHMKIIKTIFICFSWYLDFQTMENKSSLSIRF